MTHAKHIGIVAVSAEGAALCYRTICAEGATLLGPHRHPQVSMHTYPLSDYMEHVEAGRWEAAGRLLLRSARLLADAGAEVLITADHGNAEMMHDDDSGQVHTQHTTNLVPFLYVGRPATLAESGALQDVAPTLLAMMGVEQPAEMTGHSLIRFA